jgi:hypothetical protein
MRTQNGIFGKKREQKQAHLRTLQKFGFAKTVLGFLRWTGQQIFVTGQ